MLIALSCKTARLCLHGHIREKNPVEYFIWFLLKQTTKNPKKVFTFIALVTHI